MGEQNQNFNLPEGWYILWHFCKKDFSLAFLECQHWISTGHEAIIEIQDFSLLNYITVSPTTH